MQVISAHVPFRAHISKIIQGGLWDLLRKSWSNINYLWSYNEGAEVP